MQGPRYPCRSIPPASAPRPAWCTAASTAQPARRNRRGAVPHLGLCLRQRRAGRGDLRRQRRALPVFTRFGNPTVAMLEARLAGIEGAEACRATATGMAAVHAAHAVAPEGRRPRRCLARAVRLVPLDRLDAAAALRHRHRVRRWRRPGAMAGRARQAHPARAAGDAVQPDAGDRRPAGGRASWRTTPARSSWSTTCSPRRCCSSR